MSGCFKTKGDVRWPYVNAFDSNHSSRTWYETSLNSRAMVWQGQSSRRHHRDTLLSGHDGE